MFNNVRAPGNFPVWVIGLTDLVITLSTTLIVQIIWRTNGKLLLTSLNLPGKLVPTYTAISVGIVALWLLLLTLFGSRKQQVLGQGTEEYSRVARATLFTFVIVALFSYLFKAEIARGYVLLSFPIGLLLLLLTRWGWRKVLLRQRAAGRFNKRAVVVGSARSADELCSQLQEFADVGVRVVGAFLSKHQVPLSESQQLTLAKSGVPIWGGIDDLIPVVRQSRVDTVIIGSTDDLDARDVRKLGWELLPSRERLLLAANIVDVAGPRLSVRPLAGVPLIEVEQPQLEGLNRLFKRSLDLLLGIVLLILSLPVFIFVAAQIKICDGQKVFFTQERVGRNGKPFTMLKFRSMRVGAETEIPALREEEHDLAGNTVLFKLKDDPRVTKTGRWLRRTSIDELPQLLNVVLGQMSLVGPRPPLQHEVDKYDQYVMSRFIVKPGMTGLWQISGRSELSWEESVRADLSYVQNWSIFTDLVILWRTVKVVVTGRGAY